MDLVQFAPFFLFLHVMGAILAFGTERDALQVIRAVQRAHESVTGTMPDGTTYAANDPHLLGWVHVAEIDSFLAAHDRYGHRRLVGPERDEYVAQTGVAAGHLGVIDPPQTEDELRRENERLERELEEERSRHAAAAAPPADSIGSGEVAGGDPVAGSVPAGAVSAGAVPASGAMR